MRIGAWALLLLLPSGCIRESSSYDVHLYGEGTWLDEVEPTPEPMGGAVEVARYRLWGTNLGHGITTFFGDQPRADGTSFTIGYAEFGYPPDPAYDRTSTFLSPGPAAAPTEDACLTRVGVTRSPLVTEYVDVGDAVVLQGAGRRFVLPRDPAVIPRPAGEAWYVGYGGSLGPVVMDHPLLPATWGNDEAWSVSFPGTLQPPEATFGAIPYPAEAAVTFPPDIEDLTVNDEEVRPPGVGRRNEVRFAGPWEEPTVLRWTPSTSGDSLTVTVRYLGWGVETACDCSTDCGDGFVCEDGWCTGEEGAGWNVLGEVACTVEDDGEFALRAADLERLDVYADPRDPDYGVGGVVLLVSRMSEGTLAVSDALTWNGKRVAVTPVRTRVIDTIVTRLEMP